MASLMLGMDFSKTDLQVSLWNEEHTCAEIYNFSGMADGEFIPAMVIYREDGTFLIGKEAVDYSLKEKKSGITALYGQGALEHTEHEEGQKPAEELLAGYIGEILTSIRKRYGGAQIARIGITGERMNETEQNRLCRAFELLGYSEDRLYFSSHADAFFWYEMYEGERAHAMTLDYDSRGMLSYLLHPGDEIKGTPYYIETTDYSELMSGGLTAMREEEERAECFLHMTELALNRREIRKLYVTGLYAETPQATKLLGGFSGNGRRVFSGRTLYTLGACWHAVKEHLPKNCISDRQIFHNVSLLAYQDAREGFVSLVLAGTPLSEAESCTQVLLDDTQILKFEVEDVRTGERLTCTFHPDDLRERENRTTRLEVRVSFLDYNTLVIKLRDLGFGSIYPPTFRVWEQIVHLGKQ